MPQYAIDGRPKPHQVAELLEHLLVRGIRAATYQDRLILNRQPRDLLEKSAFYGVRLRKIE